MVTSDGKVGHLGRTAILSGLLALAGIFSLPAPAADLSLPITGGLVGSVVDSAGVPQMGATIQLLNKYHQAIATATSDFDGHFMFVSLPADSYSLRASLATYLPVSRDKVPVKAGLDSVLQIHLATLISSVEISYILPASAMSDDWKWVLRSSAATRPINRYLPIDPNASDATAEDYPESVRTPIFSGTHALLSVTGGDGGPLDSDSSFSDFGTAFAVSTDLFKRNRLQFSGSFGEDATATSPAFGISAVYSRQDDNAFGRAPEVTFTAIQVAGVGSLGQLSNGSGTAALSVGSGSLRGMSLGVYEVMDPLSVVHLEYGMTGESVDYVQHTSRLSPFARVTWDGGKLGQMIVSYSDGGRPDQLLRHSPSGESDSLLSEDDLAAEAGSWQRLPQISNRDGKLVLQRTQAYEIGYNKVSGSRTYAISAFSEDVTDGRLSVAGPIPSQLALDTLSDSLSLTSVYNTGQYRRTGFLSSVDQRISSQLELDLAYGKMGGFQGQSASGLLAGDSLLHERNANFASASVKASVPHAGTRLQASYGWVDSGTVIPRHLFTTQLASAAPGLNVNVRQPLPTFFGLPGRFEVTADLRNLLSQGYLPVNSPGGRQMMIVQAPESLRGGLNFIF